VSPASKPATSQGSRRALADGLSFLRSILLLDPLIWFYTAVLGTLSLLSSLVDRGGRIQHGFARVWSWLILKTIRCPVRVCGREHISPGRPAVYAANHLSALDIPVIYVHLPFAFRIMAKKELFRYPFLGWHLRRSGQIPIDRESARASMRSLNLAVQALKAGMPLVVFPEGGRSANGQVQTFMSGAFYAAIRAGVDVVPMALVGTYEVLPMNSFHIRPGPVELLIGEPVSTEGLTPRDMERLAARVQNAVEELYYSRARIPGPGPVTLAIEEPTT
jgi:1-acyl-sn-glycerol-3-phosphate acyltransferase